MGNESAPRGRPDGRGGRRTSLLTAPLRPLANLGGGGGNMSLRHGVIPGAHFHTEIPSAYALFDKMAKISAVALRETCDM
jgi:hypothetical protein